MQFVAEVSDPAHPKYGQYMTMSEVNAFTQPKAEDVATIVDFISTVCAPEVDAIQGMVSCDMSVADAEALFNTEFRRFTQVATGQSVVRAKVRSIASRALPPLRNPNPTTSLHIC